MKKCKGERVCFISQFKGTICRGGEVPVAGVWGGWSYSIYSQEAETTKVCAQFALYFFFFFFCSPGTDVSYSGKTLLPQSNQDNNNPPHAFPRPSTWVIPDLTMLTTDFPWQSLIPFLVVVLRFADKHVYFFWYHFCYFQQGSNLSVEWEEDNEVNYVGLETTMQYLSILFFNNFHTIDECSWNSVEKNDWN